MGLLSSNSLARDSSCSQGFKSLDADDVRAIRVGLCCERSRAQTCAGKRRFWTLSYVIALIRMDEELQVSGLAESKELRYASCPFFVLRQESQDAYAL